MLHPVAPCCTMLRHVSPCCTMLHYVAPNCTILHHVATCCTILRHFAPFCTMLHHVAPCRTMLHQVAPCCLQCPEDSIFSLRRASLRYDDQSINHRFHRREGKPRPWAVGAFSDHMAARCSAGQPARRNVRCIVQALTIGHTLRHRHRTQGWRNAQKNCHRCQDSRFPPASIVFAIPARILWSTACQWGLLPREKNEVQALLSPSELFKSTSFKRVHGSEVNIFLYF